MTGARTTWITAAGIGIVLVAYACLVWDHRWISDDGLIVVRSVREILAGNGPVYSPFERAEPTTSTLWLWLLAAVSAISPADIARTAVALGGVLAIAGIALVMDAARRSYHEAGHRGAVLPLGALAFVAIFPSWDFATSGLESGLALCWLGALWWLLVALRADARVVFAFAFVAGLGPLVRPDFTLVTAVFLVAGWRVVRPSRWQTLRLACLAFALPAAYEVFRAGYYGVLVPLPALAKSASGSAWFRGGRYLLHFVEPLLLYIPLGIGIALVAVERRIIATRRRAVPVVAGVLLTAFVVRVGGDFMFGRMWLPPLLLLLAPIAVVPATRIAAAATALMFAWAVVVGVRAYTAAHVGGDERMQYVRRTRVENPTSAADHVAAEPVVAAQVATALRDGQHLVFSDGIPVVPMSGAHDAPMVIATGYLGLAGALAPLDGIVVDLFGLANPIGARITRTQRNRVGHEKRLPLAWLVADVVDPAATTNVPADAIAAARHAMTCGALAELLASVREPMSVSRFWANLVGSVGRTRLEIPSDPIEAEREFCGPR